MNILLIGAGQLGSRHLQACLKHINQLNIYVVDSSETSLEISKNRAAEVEFGANHKVFYFVNMSLVEEKEIDIMILATGAAVRYSVLIASLDRCNIKSIIFEKVLFQDLQSYINASKVLKEKGITAFVNCPLRVYPFYKSIKELYINNLYPTTLSYEAGEWCGLACNSIHYIDLMDYFTGVNLKDVNTENLDRSLVESKRKDCIEFTGVLHVSFVDGSHVSINSIKGSEQTSVIQIMNGDYKVIVDELTGKYKVYEKDLLIEDSQFEIIYQSNLTNKMIEQIDAKGSCELITYEESRIIHEKYISALLNHYNEICDEVENSLCLPIT